MTSTMVHDLFPADLADWKVETVRLDRRFSATARRRRSGVTLLYRQLAGGGWQVTKMKGGQVLAERNVLHLPQHVHNIIDPHRRARR